MYFIYFSFLQHFDLIKVFLQAYTYVHIGIFHSFGIFNAAQKPKEMTPQDTASKVVYKHEIHVSLFTQFPFIRMLASVIRVGQCFGLMLEKLDIFLNILYRDRTMEWVQFFNCAKK